LSLRRLVDEDTQAKPLINLLRRAGHDVVSVNDVDLEGAADDRVLEYACLESRVLLTRNCEEFRWRQAQRPDHPGVCGIYRERDPRKNMSHVQVCRALENLEAGGLDLTGQFFVLNAWLF
jgi:predicted nuclease of predicted toxin-antitoxin system